MKNSEDRRARRSRKLLKESLLTLMKRKSFSEISVRDVTDEADMNRGTFYLHYSGTADLLQNLEEDLLNEMQVLIDTHIPETMEEGTVRPVLEPVLDFILDRRETCEILFRSSEASGFFQALQQFIRRNGEPLIETWFHPQDQALTDYFLSFLTWGFIGLLKEWFDQGMSVPREELIAAAQRAADGAASYFFLKEKVSKKNFLTRRETVREGGACSDRRKETRL